jgi:hypothetical protein
MHKFGFGESTFHQATPPACQLNRVDDADRTMLTAAESSARQLDALRTCRVRVALPYAVGTGGKSFAWWCRHPLRPLDSGLLIRANYAAQASGFEPFRDVRGIESFTNKGLLYAYYCNKSGSLGTLVITAHLNGTGDSFCEVQHLQLRQARELVVRLSARFSPLTKHFEVVFAGDCNVSAGNARLLAMLTSPIHKLRKGGDGGGGDDDDDDDDEDDGGPTLALLNHPRLSSLAGWTRADPIDLVFSSSSVSPRSSYVSRSPEQCALSDHKFVAVHNSSSSSSSRSSI